jgi:hypothetical protein
MFKKTKQADLGRFSARWGCYTTCIINIMEVELTRRLLPGEVRAVIGAWFLSENVNLSNYKDHDLLAAGYPEKDGWGPKEDPEWHYWVANQNAAVRDAMVVLGIPKLTNRYRIIKWDIGHFVLEINGGHIINPDPSLHGTPVDKRWVEV